MNRPDRDSDGGSVDNSIPRVTLVLFDIWDRDLERTLSDTLQQFFFSIGERIPSTPQVSVQNRPCPSINPFEENIGRFCKLLDDAPGNIRIGVIDVGLWTFSPPPRFIFGQGCRYGSAVLSTYRFRRETQSRKLLHLRLSREVIKILGLACNLDACDDPWCMLTYHRAVEDLDRNRYICRHCRDQFIASLGELFNNFQQR